MSYFEFRPLEPPVRLVALVAEGICPSCETPLERRESSGWCPRCDVGWSTDGETVSSDLSSVVKHIEIKVDTSAWDRASLHPPKG